MASASLSVISTVESVSEACRKTKWSKRSTMQVEQMEALMKAISVSKNRRTFDDFCTKLVGKIGDCLVPLKKLSKLSSVARLSKAVEKISTSFHTERIVALQSLWNSLLVALRLAPPDPLWCQSVTRHLFDSMKLDFVKACTSEVEREEPGATVMAAEEENALRNTSGYVPFKLLKRYSQQMEHDPEAEAVAETLSQMASLEN